MPLFIFIIKLLHLKFTNFTMITVIIIKLVIAKQYLLMVKLTIMTTIIIIILDFFDY